MIISLVNKLFPSKQASALNAGSKRTSLTRVQADEQHANEAGAKDVIASLLNSYEQYRSTMKQPPLESEIEKSWTAANTNTICVFKDASYIVRDSKNAIVKTGDVLRRIKEYRHDQNDAVQVKKFGVWNALNGALLDDGTLITYTRDGETHERLDGTVIYISSGSQSLIAQNENTGEEITLNLKGGLRHRWMKDGIDFVEQFSREQLLSKSETYSEPRHLTVLTMAENVALENVCRVERNFSDGVLESESYAFFHASTGNQAVKVSLTLSDGELHLSKVKRLQNIYRDGELCETVFDLSEPVSVSRDKEGNVSLIRGISKVRRFQIHKDVYAVVFIDHAGDENLFFPAI